MEDEPSAKLNDKQFIAHAQLIRQQWWPSGKKPGETIGIEEFLAHAVDSGNFESAIDASIAFLKELENPNGNPTTLGLCVKNDDGRQLLWLARSATSCRELGEDLLRLVVALVEWQKLRLGAKE